MTEQYFKIAYEKAMELCGFVMIVEEGWVGQKFKDGSFQKIKELDKVSKIDIVLT